MKLGPEDRLLALVVRHLDFEHPSLTYCHIPNEGKRNPLKAHMLGIRAGAPDVVIFEPRGKFIGLAIELKVGKNTLSPAQLGFLEKLRKKGWCTVVCYTIEEVTKRLTDYMEL